MTIDEIRALLNDLESDRVERTISTTNTDKFGQAICAFANDLPDHRMPGYLFLGVTDDGEVKGVNVTDDRIEMMNHGGLYGRANEQNFPKVNDYRNIVVAEAMKVLGFVNRHSRGVLRVQKDLKANENGEAVYDFSYQTAVMVTEMKSPRGERATAEAIANGFLTEADLQERSEKGSDLTIFEGKGSQKPSNLTENDQKPSKEPSNLTENDGEKQPNLSISDFPTMVTWNVYQAIKLNRKAKYSWLQDNLGVSESTILRAIKDLKELGYIDPEHSKVKGELSYAESS